MVMTTKKHRLIYKINWVLVGCVILVICLYFGRLFWPPPRVFYTVERAGGDMWNFNYPVKSLLSQALKEGRIPLWTNQLSTGAPILAESQMGGLFIPNLVLFGMLPMWLGWNLCYIWSYK